MNIREVLENKIKNYTDSLAFMEVEKIESLNKISRSDNEIKLLKTQVI